MPVCAPRAYIKNRLFPSFWSRASGGPPSLFIIIFYLLIITGGYYAIKDRERHFAGLGWPKAAEVASSRISNEADDAQGVPGMQRRPMHDVALPKAWPLPARRCQHQQHSNRSAPGRGIVVFNTPVPTPALSWSWRAGVQQPHTRRCTAVGAGPENSATLWGCGEGKETVYRPQAAQPQETISVIGPGCH